MALPDGKDLDYLMGGTPVQQEVYYLIQRYGLCEMLKDYHPVLVGTVPLDLQIPGSDLDLICEVFHFHRFADHVRRHFGHFPGFTLTRRRVHGVERLKANFNCGNWPVEVFAQPIPAHQQNGYRHMMAEARVLRLFGEDFKRAVIQLKQQGFKTEPAFASLLGLEGDPYLRLLDLTDWTDEELVSKFTSPIAGVKVELLNYKK
ncbi:DUF4269 domain-containing protein [Paenibacillus sp. A14]|uniref:DUF4269 domain-containing protein n=1 Tax=Paenibacillus sp. A14 TaxID=3119820 RepID=UPI002FDFDCAD